MNEDRVYAAHSSSTAVERNAARDRLLYDVVQSVPSQSGALRSDAVGSLRGFSACQRQPEIRTSEELADHRALCITADGDPRRTGHRVVSGRWVCGRQATPAGGRASESGVILCRSGGGSALAKTCVPLLVLRCRRLRSREPCGGERDSAGSSRLQNGRIEFPGPIHPSHFLSEESGYRPSATRTRGVSLASARERVPG